MICPVCGNTLSSCHLAKTAIDFCHGGCGGFWFDVFELSKVDESHELTNDEILRPKFNLADYTHNQQKRICPRCTETPMMRHFFSPSRQVEVDTCPQCAGVWLDSGELQKIRAEKANLNDNEHRTQVLSFVELVRQRQSEYSH